MTATEKIKSIQSTLGVAADGQFGPLSRAALNAAIIAADSQAAPPVSIPPPPPGGKLDDRTEKALATLDPKAAPAFRQFIRAAREIAAQFGCEYIAIGGTRTWPEQDALYAQGRSKPGKVVTNAKGGQSWHNFGIALDMGVFRDGKYLDDSEPATASKIHKAAGEIAKQYGLEWGGSWASIKDEPHFQVATGLSMAEARERFSARRSVL